MKSAKQQEKNKTKGFFDEIKGLEFFSRGDDVSDPLETNRSLYDVQADMEKCGNEAQHKSYTVRCNNSTIRTVKGKDVRMQMKTGMFAGYLLYNE